MRKDNFYMLHSSSGKEELISFMVQNLESKGYVDSNFKNEIFDRELISSTSFDGFAIPHSMKMNAIKTGISCVILKEPVVWDEYYVNLIIMLCFNSDERYIFNEIFEPLTMILTAKDKLNKIIQSKNFDEFIDNLCAFIE